MGAIKKFLTNKTTVTFVGIILGIIVLVVGYFYRVEKSLSTVRVPVAKRTLVATELITADDIEYVKVNPEFLRTVSVYTQSNINSVVNHYVNVGTSIPKGGLFFTDQVVEKKELPNSIFDSIGDDEYIYQLKVNEQNTNYNSIFPGDTIHLRMIMNANDKQVNGYLIQNIQVLAVRDASGNNIFDGVQPGSSAWLLFVVNKEMFETLEMAEFIGGITIVPDAENNLDIDPSEKGETKMNEELARFIWSKANPNRGM